METRILVVNPNSSKSMTVSLRETIEKTFSMESCKISYFTGPDTSPPQIEGQETSIKSMEACLPLLIDDQESIYYFQKFNGILIACFSDHPLVTKIKDRAAKEKADVSIVGLLDSSINYCNLIGKKFSIITSNKEWIPILNNSVESKFLTGNTINKNLWKGTVSTDLQVLDLHSPENFQQIAEIIYRENIRKLDSDIVILGCAGFSGLQNKLAKTFQRDRTLFLDTIEIGLEILITMIRFINSQK
ncbi:BAH_G0028650.mRNA.1.CDS.1 [Saccharomyces cerevisiae]|nr:SX2_G0054220.mRNA.1.CDS.1 [Saccharomyces cerevisiae]CAD6622854.1 HLJ1_G0054450.mRNA.1.CDS.1 [Saccharomyces cerevisiae]CAI4394909.1 BAK_1a_G0027270.mRNA.1.CDS.1 [Saccharomyces cerevisiae]CAI4403744.1 CCN_G0027460.mRNA.1.CDS.1 [Saccharomyces cerevisiae]CAI4831651.1 BAH_G0028650.mRNA.1.CDS.1 [Saccharomyces cerevisiae]